MVTSIGFEILEYSLEHQLPNFSECWWDHVRFGDKLEKISFREILVDS